VASNDGARRSTRASSNGLGSMLQRAVAQFRELSGIEPEQVSGVRSTDDGWSFLVEVVDVERIPSTTSVLSTYRVDVDGSGNLVGFERIRRYNRASVDPR
jgi:Gas vesicle synthesis protein GvpO